MSKLGCDLFSLESKVIIITGGIGVIGESFVNAIVEARGTVIILARNKKMGAEKVATLLKKGYKAYFIKTDELDETSLIRAQQEIEKNLVM